MKAVKARITRALNLGAKIGVCDNSGASIVKITSIKNQKGRKGRSTAAGIGDMVMASVVKGRPDMRKQVFFAVIIRQKKEFRRPNGMRVSFEDNSAVVLKDDKGNPKGTILKGPVPREVTDRWPAIGKLATIVV